jgi:type IV pilus assembly protein PilY1
MTAAEQANFANWFSYYRKREYVAKRALSQIINDSSSRVGLATLHNNNTVRTLIKDIDDISTPIDATAQANKNNLLRNLFRVDSSGGTPLRQSLEDVGEYYEGNSSWGSSPILPPLQGGECQQNFTILMSDGVWNGGDPSVGNTDTDNNTVYDGGLYADGSSSVSNTLADVAMHYYERDLNTIMPNNVRTTPGVDSNSAQHMVTYTVAFGVSGTLADTLNPGDTGFAWPTPSSNATTTVDDMRHAAYNGRGQFLNAGNPQQLIQSLSDSISDIADRTGTAAAVAFNSTSLQTDTKLLKASFNSDRWSGDVTAFDLIKNPVTQSLSLGPIAWQGATDLNVRTAASRNVVTYDGTSGIKFLWDDLTAAQQNDLRTNALGTLDTEATGMARLDYIRGEHGCEEGSALTCFTDSGGDTFTSKTLRKRNSRLGDIIHSSPFYVGPPNTRYPANIETMPYRDFVNTYATRTGMTYVGSNDGMLHAFDDTGVERFAYIPSMLFSTANGEGLHHLTESGYVHSYYVDLSVNVADVFADLGSGTAEWHSVLIGGLRGGGKGLFAIDVTNPATLTTANGVASKVLGEFTHNDLGYTFSDIKVGKMNNGKWAAIFGNGYNSDPSGDGTSKVFILYLDGSNSSTPIMLETGAGTIANGDCTDPGSDCNGMSTPAPVDLNGDGTVDRIYAGDLHGKMWVFDVGSIDTLNWKSAYGTSPSFTPLFTACGDTTPCTASNRQPITSKPAIARHPFIRGVTTLPNLMVFFGTGQFMTTTDNLSADPQSFYGVWDAGSGNLDPDTLVAQEITDKILGGGIEVRTISDNAVDYASKRGWKIPLPTSKERAVTNSLGFGSLVFFNTMVPSTTTCAAGGTGWLMAVDMLNGGTPSFQPIDVNGDGNFDTNDKFGGATVTVGTKSSGIPTESRFISDKRVTANSDGSVVFENVQHSGPQSPSRMSWTGLER